LRYNGDPNQEKEVIFKDDLEAIFGKRPFEKEETSEEKNDVVPKTNTRKRTTAKTKEAHSRKPKSDN